MITLGEDGLAKVKSGVTTPEELLRVVTEVREMRTLCSGCGIGGRRRLHRLPALRQALGGGCPHCGRALQPGWKFCPYCAQAAPRRKRPSDAEAAARQDDAREGRRELPAANVAEFKK